MSRHRRLDPQGPGTWFAAPAMGPSAVMTRVGGREYPARNSNDCRTCNSEFRVQIENALLKSYGYTAIVRSLPENCNLNVQNIKDHFRRGHLPLDQSVRRVLIEQDGKERGLDIEGYESTLANHITFAKLGVQRVMQQMMEGELEPDLDHGIAFANLLLKVEEKAGEDFGAESLMQGFIVYMEAIRKVCTPDQLQSITDAIATHPVMKALLSRSASEARGEGAIVQGEVREDPILSVE